MTPEFRSEIERLTFNSALHREDLLMSALRKTRWRKLTNIAAGMLALLSAGTIATVMSNYLNTRALQLIAASVSLVSGTLSLISTAYYVDTDIVTMFSGAAKYLAVRESVLRLTLNTRLSDDDKFIVLSDLQDQYSKLDETYSRYFSLGSLRTHGSKLLREKARFAEALAHGAVVDLLRNIAQM